MILSCHAGPMNLIRQDISYALRQFRRSPGFTAAVVLTLALGIGANSVMLGVVDTLLLSSPPGVTGADQLRRVYVTHSHAGTAAASTLSVPDYEALRDGTPSFEGVVAYTRSEVTVARGQEAHPVQASLVTGEYFALLGVRPAVGRLFSSEEARAGGARVAVLGHGYWQQHFGADSRNRRPGTPRRAGQLHRRRRRRERLHRYRFVAAGATLLAVTLGAALIPALRATRVDPMTALRVE